MFFQPKIGKIAVCSDVAHLPDIISIILMFGKVTSARQQRNRQHHAGQAREWRVQNHHPQ
jgi:hypothetical protein